MIYPTEWKYTGFGNEVQRYISATSIESKDAALLDAGTTILPADPPPPPTYKELRKYPSIQEQLDMQFWDLVNGTTVWKDAITAEKLRVPKT